MAPSSRPLHRPVGRGEPGAVRLAQPRRPRRRRPGRGRGEPGRGRRASSGGRAVVWMEQVHGDRRRASSTALPDDRRAGPACDGAGHRRRPGSRSAVLVADCVPVLMSDAEAGVVGGGARGPAAGRDGVVLPGGGGDGAPGRAGRVDALLGPAVCGPATRCRAEMRERGRQAGARRRGRPRRRGTPGLDLRAGLRSWLAGRRRAIEHRRRAAPGSRRTSSPTAATASPAEAAGVVRFVA